MTTYKWTKDEIRTMIEMVKIRDCLWNVQHPHYHNQLKRRIYLEEIEAVLNIPVIEIKKKIHTLRAQYSKERTKMQMKNSTDGTESGYQTRWQFFDQMKFMFQQTDDPKSMDYAASETDTSTSPSGTDGVTVKMEYIDLKGPGADEKLLVNEESTEWDAEICESSTTMPPTKKRKFLSDGGLQEETVLNRCMSILAETSSRDQFAVFGEYVGNELRQLRTFPDIQLKLKYDIQKLITDANYEQLARQYGPSASSKTEHAQASYAATLSSSRGNSFPKTNETSYSRYDRKEFS